MDLIIIPRDTILATMRMVAVLHHIHPHRCLLKLLLDPISIATIIITILITIIILTLIIIILLLLLIILIERRTIIDHSLRILIVIPNLVVMVVTVDQDLLSVALRLYPPEAFPQAPIIT